MLVKYYRSRLLTLVLSTVTLLVLGSFFFWYPQYITDRAPHWATIISLYAIATLPVFLPTKRLALPDVMLPIITVLGLNSVNTTLSAISHSVTFSSLSWPLMAYTLLAVGLVSRRHTFYGWLFFASFVLLVLSWHSNYFASRVNLSTEFYIPFLLMVVSTIVPQQIEQAVSKTRQARSMRIIADAGRTEEADMSAIATQRVQEVRALTQDMLHRIAYNESPVTREEMDEFRFTEAQLRDTIRGRYIVNKEILHAAWLARQRGVKVDILDERGTALPARLSMILTQCAVDLFDNASGGTITVRAFPADDQIAVMLVHDGNSEDEEPSAIEISQTGLVERF